MENYPEGIAPYDSDYDGEDDFEDEIREANQEIVIEGEERFLGNASGYNDYSYLKNPDLNRTVYEIGRQKKIFMDTFDAYIEDVKNNPQLKSTVNSRWNVHQSLVDAWALAVTGRRSESMMGSLAFSEFDGIFTGIKNQSPDIIVKIFEKDVSMVYIIEVKTKMRDVYENSLDAISRSQEQIYDPLVGRLLRLKESDWASVGKPRPTIQYKTLFMNLTDEKMFEKMATKFIGSEFEDNIMRVLPILNELGEIVAGYCTEFPEITESVTKSDDRSSDVKPRLAAKGEATRRALDRFDNETTRGYMDSLFGKDLAASILDIKKIDHKEISEMVQKLCIGIDILPKPKISDFDDTLKKINDKIESVTKDKKSDCHMLQFAYSIVNGFQVDLKEKEKLSSKMLSTMMKDISTMKEDKGDSLLQFLKLAGNTVKNPSAENSLFFGDVKMVVKQVDVDKSQGVVEDSEVFAIEANPESMEDYAIKLTSKDRASRSKSFSNGLPVDRGRIGATKEEASKYKKEQSDRRNAREENLMKRRGFVKDMRFLNAPWTKKKTNKVELVKKFYGLDGEEVEVDLKSDIRAMNTIQGNFGGKLLQTRIRKDYHLKIERSGNSKEMEENIMIKEPKSLRLNEEELTRAAENWKLLKDEMEKVSPRSDKKSFRRKIKDAFPSEKLRVHENLIEDQAEWLDKSCKDTIAYDVCENHRRIAETLIRQTRQQEQGFRFINVGQSNQLILAMPHRPMGSSHRTSKDLINTVSLTFRPRGVEKDFCHTLVRPRTEFETSAGVWTVHENKTIGMSILAHLKSMPDRVLIYVASAFESYLEDGNRKEELQRLFPEGMFKAMMMAVQCRVNILGIAEYKRYLFFGSTAIRSKIADFIVSKMSRPKKCWYDVHLASEAVADSKRWMKESATMENFGMDEGEEGFESELARLKCLVSSSLCPDVKLKSFVRLYSEVNSLKTLVPKALHGYLEMLKLANEKVSTETRFRTSEECKRMIWGLWDWKNDEDCATFNKQEKQVCNMLFVNYATDRLMEKHVGEEKRDQIFRAIAKTNVVDLSTTKSSVMMTEENINFRTKAIVAFDGLMEKHPGLETAVELSAHILRTWFDSHKDGPKFYHAMDSGVNVHGLEKCLEISAQMKYYMPFIDSHPKGQNTEEDRIFHIMSGGLRVVLKVLEDVFRKICEDIEEEAITVPGAKKGLLIQSMYRKIVEMAKNVDTIFSKFPDNKFQKLSGSWRIYSLNYDCTKFSPGASCSYLPSFQSMRKYLGDKLVNMMQCSMAYLHSKKMIIPEIMAARSVQSSDILRFEALKIEESFTEKKRMLHDLLKNAEQSCFTLFSDWGQGNINMVATFQTRAASSLAEELIHEHFGGRVKVISANHSDDAIYLIAVFVPDWEESALEGKSQSERRDFRSHFEKLSDIDGILKHTVNMIHVCMKLMGYNTSEKKTNLHLMPEFVSIVCPAGNSQMPWIKAAVSAVSDHSTGTMGEVMASGLAKSYQCAVEGAPLSIARLVEEKCMSSILGEYGIPNTDEVNKEFTDQFPKELQPYRHLLPVAIGGLPQIPTILLVTLGPKCHVTLVCDYLERNYNVLDLSIRRKLLSCWVVCGLESIVKSSQMELLGGRVFFNNQESTSPQAFMVPIKVYEVTNPLSKKFEDKEALAKFEEKHPWIPYQEPLQVEMKRWSLALKFNDPRFYHAYYSKKDQKLETFRKSKYRFRKMVMILGGPATGGPFRDENDYMKKYTLFEAFDEIVKFCCKKYNDTEERDLLKKMKLITTSYTDLEQSYIDSLKSFKMTIIDRSQVSAGMRMREYNSPSGYFFTVNTAVLTAIYMLFRQDFDLNQFEERVTGTIASDERMLREKLKQLGISNPESNPRLVMEVAKNLDELVESRKRISCLLSVRTQIQDHTWLLRALFMNSTGDKSVDVYLTSQPSVSFVSFLGGKESLMIKTVNCIKSLFVPIFHSCRKNIMEPRSESHESYCNTISKLDEEKIPGEITQTAVRMATQVLNDMWFRDESGSFKPVDDIFEKAGKMFYESQDERVVKNLLVAGTLCIRNEEKKYEFLKIMSTHPAFSVKHKFELKAKPSVFRGTKRKTWKGPFILSSEFKDISLVSQGEDEVITSFQFNKNPTSRAGFMVRQAVNRIYGYNERNIRNALSKMSYVPDVDGPGWCYEPQDPWNTLVRFDNAKGRYCLFTVSNENNGRIVAPSQTIFSAGEGNPMDIFVGTPGEGYKVGSLHPMADQIDLRLIHFASSVGKEELLIDLKDLLKFNVIQNMITGSMLVNASALAKGLIYNNDLSIIPNISLAGPYNEMGVLEKISPTDPRFGTREDISHFSQWIDDMAITNQGTVYRHNVLRNGVIDSLLMMAGGFTSEDEYNYNSIEYLSKNKLRIMAENRFALMLANKKLSLEVELSFWGLIKMKNNLEHYAVNREEERTGQMKRMAVSSSRVFNEMLKESMNVSRDFYDDPELFKEEENIPMDLMAFLETATSVDVEDDSTYGYNNDM